MSFQTIIIGAGAAGFFAAAHAKGSVIVLEKTNQILSKVRISGGGRCNVTHGCFDPTKLVQNYPRGSRELLGPFTRWAPQDTMQWFEERGVPLKIEKDGRVFPTSDSSQTIIDCLVSAAKENGAQIRLQSKIERVTKEGNQFKIFLQNGETLECERLILATGSASQGHEIAKSFGHTIVPPVPSLFTFNVPTSSLLELSGVALPDVEVSVVGLLQRGPFLITHFGFSGPAVLKLSAWGARLLHEKNYHAQMSINWTPFCDCEQVLMKWKQEKSRQQIGSENPFAFPKTLWRRFLELVGIDPLKKLSDASRQEILRLSEKLRKDLYQIEGKTTHKEEFVTSGGISLKEVNFKTMESRLCSRLHFAGEVLDIDGVTGGFNFQNAWTTAYLAAL